jgi:hypothetical protein
LHMKLRTCSCATRTESRIRILCEFEGTEWLNQ